MTITIHSTQQITWIDDVPFRVWEGVTESGTRCAVFVHMIAVSNSEDLAQFDAELIELPRPTVFHIR